MSLYEDWQAAARSPFQPGVSKDSQLYTGFALLLIAFLSTGFFVLSRSLASSSAFGLIASVAFGFGAVFTICGVGVYV